MNRFSSLLICATFFVVLFVVQWYGLDYLRYERNSFAGQWWQALSHTLIHLNFQHLILNAFALVLMVFLFSAAFESTMWLVVLACSAISSTLGMYWFSPEVEWCVGLSGALHGLFIYAVIRSRAHWLWILGITLKIFVEQTSVLDHNSAAGLTEQFIQGRIVVDAHLWGAVGGILLILVRAIGQLSTYIEISKQN